LCEQLLISAVGTPCSRRPATTLIESSYGWISFKSHAGSFAAISATSSGSGSTPAARIDAASSAAASGNAPTLRAGRVSSNAAAMVSGVTPIRSATRCCQERQSLHTSVSYRSSRTAS
jgi:hypothetical protein